MGGSVNNEMSKRRRSQSGVDLCLAKQGGKSYIYYNICVKKKKKDMKKQKNESIWERRYVLYLSFPCLSLSFKIYNTIFNLDSLILYFTRTRSLIY